MTTSVGSLDHLVMFNLPPDCRVDRYAFVTALEELWATHDDIATATVEVDCGIRPAISCDVFGRATFESTQAFERYLQSKSHREFVDSVIRPHRVELTSMQITYP